MMELTIAEIKRVDGGDTLSEVQNWYYSQWGDAEAKNAPAFNEVNAVTGKTAYLIQTNWTARDAPHSVFHGPQYGYVTYNKADPIGGGEFELVIDPATDTIVTDQQMQGTYNDQPTESLAHAFDLGKFMFLGNSPADFTDPSRFIIAGQATVEWVDNTFSSIVSGAASYVSQAVSSVWNWITSSWQDEPEINC